MKLRNKKTGEHGDYKVISAGNLIRVHDSASDESWQYDSLASFNEKWDDYQPAEPLIKDPKIRKAVRAWAEANDYDTVLYDKVNDCIYSPYGSDETDTSVTINFDLDGLFRELENRGEYTIAELCGEEEE